MADDNLQINVTAEASSAIAQTDSLDAALGRLIKSIGASGAAATEASAGQDKLASSSAKSLSIFEKMEPEAYRLARGLDALGLGGASAASKIGAMTGALQDLKAAAPEIMAIVAVFGAIQSAWSFVSSAPAEAEKWNDELLVLGSTIKVQGGDWTNLKQSVLDFAQVQSDTTRFTRDEVITSFQELATAGVDVHDAMEIIRVSEDAAAATGHSLTDVVHGLMEAEHGRTQVLTQMGFATRQQIKDGMSMSELLTVIEHNTANVALKQDEYTRATNSLHNSTSDLKVLLGDVFLPILAHAEDAINKVVLAFQNWRSITDIFKQEFQAFSSQFVSYLGFMATAAVDFFSGHFKAAVGDAKLAMASFSQAFSALDTDLGHRLQNQMSFLLNQRQGRSNASPTSFSLDDNSQVGGKLGGGGNAAAKAARELRDAIALTISEYDHQREAAGKAGDVEIKAIDKEIAELKVLAQTKGISAKQEEEIHGKIIALQNKEAQVRAEVARKVEEAEKRKQEAQKKTYDDMVRHLDDQVKMAEDFYGKDSAQYLAALQKEMESLKVWLDANKNANSQLVDDAKLKYAELFKAYDDEIDAELKAAQKHTDDMNKENQKWIDKATSFLDSFFQAGKRGTQSFADAWKKMLQDMEQALLKSAIAKLLSGVLIGGAGLGTLFGSPAAAAPGSVSGIQSSAQQAGVFGALFGSAGAASIGASLPTTGGIAGLMLGNQVPALGAGGAGGGSVANIANVTTIIAGGGAASSSSFSSITGGGGGGGLAGLLGNLGTATMAGLVGGDIIGNLIGGDSQTFAGIGGALGGGAGAFLAAPFVAMGLLSPLGALAFTAFSAIVGGEFGNLFGDHNSKQNEPDKYLSGYGKFVADVNGVAGNFNGGVVRPDADYMGTGAIAYRIASFIKGGTQGLTPAELAAYNALKPLGGTDDNYGIAGEKNDVFTLGSGAKVKVETYMALVSQFMKATNGGTSAVPVFNVTHDFPDFGGAMIAGAGSYTPSSPTGGAGSVVGNGAGTTAPVTVATASMASMSMSAGSGGGSGGGIVVNVNVSGSLIAQSNLAQYLSEILADLVQTRGARSAATMYSRGI